MLPRKGGFCIWELYSRGFCIWGSDLCFYLQLSSSATLSFKFSPLLWHEQSHSGESARASPCNPPSTPPTPQPTPLNHPSAISFFWIHTILHDILGFDTIITRYQQYSMTLDLCKICQKIVLSAWYALVIHTMVHIECIKCIKVAKNMPIHAKVMFLNMQRVKWS